MKRLLSLLILTACSRPAEAPRAPHAPAPPPPTADSLVLTLPDSSTIWLLAGRKGLATDGSTCDEWSIQTRNGSAHHLVPLLYTRHAPRLVRGKVLAIQSNHCVDGDVYLIEPATGYPFKQTGTR